MAQAKGSVQSLNQLAVVALRQGWGRMAEGIFRRVLKSDPGKVAVWLRLGAVLARQERWSEARDAFAKARALDPKAPLDPQLLAFIEQKAAADSQGSGGLGGGSPPR